MYVDVYTVQYVCCVHVVHVCVYICLVAVFLCCVQCGCVGARYMCVHRNVVNFSIEKKVYLFQIL